MKKWKHINYQQRKDICSGLAHNYTAKELGELLELDPTAISKEVKRNRIPINNKYDKESNCDKLNRWPYVCDNCPNKYGTCPFVKFKYVAKTADNLAKAKLINSRRGLDLDSEEFKLIDTIIKKGIDEDKSIYQIKLENKDTIKKSITTLYRYIGNGYLTTKRIDLPYAVKYKKRKHNKKYEYSNNNIDRTNHTYLDYLSYIHSHPNSNVWQLDFLGAIKSDNSSILSFILPNVHFTLLDIIKNPNADKVVEFFDNIEERIGTEKFKELIPVILTDRDPCFADIIGISFSKITGEERCRIFFCDPYVSNQKPNVENINKQLRKYFPKGKTIDNLTRKEVKNKNEILNNTPIKILDGYSPKEAFIKIYGNELYNDLFK